MKIGGVFYELTGREESNIYLSGPLRKETGFELSIL